MEQDEVDAKLEEANKETILVNTPEVESTRKIIEAPKEIILPKIQVDSERQQQTAQTETTNIIDERLIKETILKETSAITTKEILILQKVQICFILIFN